MIVQSIKKSARVIDEQCTQIQVKVLCVCINLTCLLHQQWLCNRTHEDNSNLYTQNAALSHGC